MALLAALDFTAIAGIAVGFGLLVVIPVVAILTEHQRKMARILQGQEVKEEAKEHGQVVIGIHAGKHRKAGESESEILNELRSLRNEVADLRLQVATLSERQPSSIESRLSEVIPPPTPESRRTTNA